MNPLLFQPAEFLPSVEIPAAETQSVATEPGGKKNAFY